MIWIKIDSFYDKIDLFKSRDFAGGNRSTLPRLVNSVYKSLHYELEYWKFRPVLLNYGKQINTLLY
jgi:hypothetical protein